jgi:hypothetical protein
MEYITRQWVLQTFFSLDLSVVKIHYDSEMSDRECIFIRNSGINIHVVSLTIKVFVNENINMKFYNEVLVKGGF